MGTWAPLTKHDGLALVAPTTSHTPVTSHHHGALMCWGKRAPLAGCGVGPQPCAGAAAAAAAAAAATAAATTAAAATTSKAGYTQPPSAWSSRSAG